MPKIILDLGFLKVSASYLQERASGRFYYHRRIPADVQGHYGKKRFRVQSLKTTDKLQAVKAAAKLAAEDDAYWKSLRDSAAKGQSFSTPEVRDGAKALIRELGLSEGAGHGSGPDAHRQISDVVDVLDAYFIKAKKAHKGDYEKARKDEWYSLHEYSPQSFYTPVEAEAVRLIMGDPSKPRMLLSDALKHYLENRKKTPSAKFIRDNTSYVGRVTAAVGDLPLTDYRREHAHKVRDQMLSTGMTTGTARRALNAISAIFNHGLREFDLGGNANPFESVPIAGEGEDAKGREPFTPDELKAVKAACELKDDDIRHIVALQADTGARIAEIVGLRFEDVVLDEAVPYIHIRAYESLGRTLKNTNSARRVPLVGLALWGARRAVEAAQKHDERGWLFPRYAADGDVKATHASNTINKWLRQALKIDKTTHSFRHTMRDRLRAVEAPEEVQDAIGGWKSQGSIGRSYGQGYVLSQLRGWLEKATSP